MELSEPPLFIERDYPILLNQIGPDKALRPHVVFDYMQDIAAQHADLLKVGMSYLKELGTYRAETPPSGNAYRGDSYSVHE